jgi:putative membrane protein
MRAVLFGVIASLTVLTGGTSRAQAPIKPAAAFDQLFLRNEATGSAYELAIAQLAQSKATRDDVKTYAGLLVNDHEAYNGALRDLAKQKGITLAPALTAKGQAQRDGLAKLQGMAFDRAFIREARRINDEDVRSFRQEASRTADPDIRAFVTKFLAIEEQHAKAAAALSGTAIATAPITRTPVIKPPATGSNMPVITPPSNDSAMPVIPPPAAAK